VWHRMTMDSRSPEDASVRFAFYCAESRKPLLGRPEPGSGRAAALPGAHRRRPTAAQRAVPGENGAEPPGHPAPRAAGAVRLVPIGAAGPGRRVPGDRQPAPALPPGDLAFLPAGGLSVRPGRSGLHRALPLHLPVPLRRSGRGDPRRVPLPGPRRRGPGVSGVAGGLAGRGGRLPVV
jgi:hypothetical protein